MEIHRHDRQQRAELIGVGFCGGPNRRGSATVLIGWLLLAACPAAALGEVEVESFDGGVFTNPFFLHDIEFDCCWAINSERGRWVLHLEPNTDLITFDLPEGQRVQSVSVEIEDFEGGFVGNRPTSAAIVRGAGGDFVLLQAAEIGVREVLFADVNTPGRITGEPIGEIVSIHFQAANEGNSVIPEKRGANFDDILVEVVPRGGCVRKPEWVCDGDVDGDGQVNPVDSGLVQAAFGSADESDLCQYDVDCDGQINPVDSGIVQSLFGTCEEPRDVCP